MPTKEEIMQEMEKILIPGVMRNPAEMNVIRNVSVSQGNIDITLSTAALNPEAQQWLSDKIKDACGSLEGIENVNISFTEAKPAELNEVKNVIAIMSGKGGVGKSLVSGLVAVALRRQGYTVGILDADITGPSIPKMFGVNTRPGGSESGILPVTSRLGIEVMSINLLLPSESEAVIWRGPLIGRAITQFWEEVLWGKLDYLIIDLPPGTADAPLTVLQSLPVSGIVIVFTPQDLTAMVVGKAVTMVRKMDKPIIGVVENMSYLYVPEIDKKIEIFGKSRGLEMANSADAPLLGEIPIDPELAKLCDAGEIERYDAGVVKDIGEALIKEVEKS